MRYGRPKSRQVQKENADAAPKETEKNSSAVQVLVLGIVAVALFFGNTILHSSRARTDNDIPEAVAVMSTGFQEETEREEVVSPGADSRSGYQTGVEPFGYLDGEWNIWEYIGDLFSSLLLA